MTPEDFLQLCQTPSVDLSCPAHEPPVGQLALDSNAYTLLPTTIAISVICSILILAAVSIRIYTRCHLMHQFALEDYLMILATVGFFGFLGCIFASAPFGLGKHMWNFTLGQVLALLHLVYIGQIINCIHIATVKLAIVLQIKQIFTANSVLRGFMYWAAWSTIVLLSGSYMAVFFLCVFSCFPVRRAWKPTVEGWCMEKSLPGISGATVNLVTDLVILSLPIIGVARLKMPRSQKIAVAAVFATGAIACTFSALRLYYTLDKNLQNDYTYWIVVQATCATAESTAVMLCCCFPVFPRFWKYARQASYSGRGSAGIGRTPPTQDMGGSHCMRSGQAGGQRRMDCCHSSTPWSDSRRGGDLRVGSKERIIGIA